MGRKTRIRIFAATTGVAGLAVAAAGMTGVISGPMAVILPVAAIISGYVARRAHTAWLHIRGAGRMRNAGGDSCPAEDTSGSRSRNQAPLPSKAPRERIPS